MSRNESSDAGVTVRVEPHGLSWWSFILSLLQKAGARIDDNGSW